MKGAGWMMIKRGNTRDEKYVRPKMAEEKFKMAQSLQQNVYLYGITGIGKTAFVKDMLGRKSFNYYSAEESGAEQILLPEDDKPHIIVVDDLHHIMDDRRREEYTDRLRVLMQCRNIWLILIARCAIPRWLMPLHVENTFLIIQEKDLYLDRLGQDAYFEKWNIKLSLEQSKNVWQLAGGNPLFLRFVAMAGGDTGQAVDDLWKYFLYLYDQWDTELKEFMMEISVLKHFNASMAQMVTGRKNAQQLLKRALETGNFITEKNGTYEYNFILQEHMHVLLERKFDTDQLAHIYYNAGHMYEMNGDVLNALKMYEAGGDEKSILRLLIANARQNPATGCYFELRRYYLMLPEDSICTSPVLMAGMSMLQSMLMNPEESERWYHLLEEYVAKCEGSAKREAKSRLLYLDIGLPHRGSVQIQELMQYADTLLKEGKAILPEFSVTSNLPSLMNGGKDFCEWSKRDKALAVSIGKIVEFVLGKYGKGLVSIALAESYFEKGHDSGEIVSLAEKGRMQAEAGGKMEQVFVAVGILVWLSVLNGYAGDAQDMLESFRQMAEKEVPQLLDNLEAFQCRIAFYQGGIPQIHQWMEGAPDENKDFCSLERFRYLTKVRGYIQFGRYDKAYSLLQKMLYYAKMQKRDYVAMESMLLLAVVKYRIKEKGWESLLQECIQRAEEYHFVRIFSREGGAILKLLKAGDFTWHNEEYRRQVFKECEKMGRQYPFYLKEKMEGDIVLSENALNILRLQAEGYRMEEIAEQLNITTNTVKYHNRETYRKLGVSGKAAAVNEAKNRGLI